MREMNVLDGGLVPLVASSLTVFRGFHKWKKCYSRLLCLQTECASCTLTGLISSPMNTSYNLINLTMLRVKCLNANETAI